MSVECMFSITPRAHIDTRNMRRRRWRFNVGRVLVLNHPPTRRNRWVRQ
jgi:hypothetical protein